MKTLIRCSLFAMLALGNLGRAQSVVAYATGCGLASANGPYTNDGTAFGSTETATNGLWVLYFNSYLSRWSLSNTNYDNGYYATYYTTSGTNPAYIFSNTWGGSAGSSYVNPPPTFSAGPPIDPTTPIFSTTLTNFWPANGGNLIVNASGIASSNAILLITANSNVLFASGVSTNAGTIWNLRGVMNYDGSNAMNSSFSIGGIGVPGATFFTASNFVGTNVSLSFALDALYDTNLTVQNVQISGQQAVAGIQPVFTWPPPLTFLPLYTPATTNSSTFGYGAGLLTCDTNYLYISIGTNAWRRMSIPLGVW